MLFHLIAMVAAGFGAAGLYLGARKILGPALPRWAMPAAIGAAMIAFTIWSEYSWAGRTVGTLPEGTEVTFRGSRSDFWRPWTYAFPLTTRLAAVDRAPASAPAVLPDGTRFAHVYLMERWGKSLRISALFDCAGRRLSEVGPDLEAAVAAGTLAWTDLPDDDAALGVACEEV